MPLARTFPRIKSASLVSVVVLAIGVTAVIAGQTLIGFFAKSLSQRLPPTDREIVVATAPFDPSNLDGIHDLTGTRDRVANAIAGLDRFALFRAAYHPVKMGDRDLLKRVIGVDDRFFPVFGVSARSGRLRFQEDAGVQQECAISQQLLGQAVRLDNRSGELDIAGSLCRIAGIIDLSDPFIAGRVDKNAIFTGFEFPAFAQSSSQEKGVVMSFAPGVAPSEQAIKQKLMPILGVEHLDYWSYREQLARNQRLLGFVTLAANGIALGFLLIVALNAAAFVSHTVAEREKEIGLKRALGATRLTIFMEIQREVLLIGGVAFLAGLALAQLLAQTAMPAILNALTDFSGTQLAIPQQALLPGVIAGLLVPAIASMAPAIRAGNISPSIALRDD